MKHFYVPKLCKLPKFLKLDTSPLPVNSLRSLVCLFQDYLLPEEYVQTMKPLRSNAPEMSLEDVYTVIREDLKIEVNINYKQICCRMRSLNRH